MSIAIIPGQESKRMEIKLFKSIKELPREEKFAPGHAMCAGCGAAIAMRWLNKVAPDDTIFVIATGCVEVTTTACPYTAWLRPCIHVAFENAAAVASGIEAAIKILKKKGIINKDIKVVAIAGDGGTVDIGLQALSGMLERKHKVMYVLYDNEAYMNTGIQRSGATPLYAWTTTTPVGRVIKGKLQEKKDIDGIVAAHRIPYMATTTIAYILDMVNKFKKALEYTEEGPTFVHVLCPCVPGWRIDPHMTVKLSRLAVETGMWINYEIEHGVFRVTTRVPKRKPVAEYIKPQGRFRHLTDKDIELIQRLVDENVERINRLVGEQVIGPVELPEKK